MIGLPPEYDLMAKLERVAAHNLQDYVVSFRHIAPETEASYLEVADGVATFTGIGSPLTTVKGTGPRISPGDLQAIESFFRGHRAGAVTIESAPWLDEASRALLGEHGYAVADREDVVAAMASSSSAPLAVRAVAVPADEWPELVRRCSELPDESPITELLTASGHLPDARLLGIRATDRWIACAQSVPYDDVVIFGNDATLPEARGRGAQSTLIEERLAALPDGTIAVAEVAPGSGSERNYLRRGFQLAYARRHYVRALL